MPTTQRRHSDRAYVSRPRTVNGSPRLYAFDDFYQTRKPSLDGVIRLRGHHSCGASQAGANIVSKFWTRRGSVAGQSRDASGVAVAASSKIHPSDGVDVVNKGNVWTYLAVLADHVLWKSPKITGFRLTWIA
ncbi:hypothetical protein E4U40_004036 [Claviceps sp. LM458 group G5]|nr:hypothetical protein E4U40_004036 [Claviceps sp. LM458 group G5]